MKNINDDKGNKPGILILYHCKANTGYAIGTLEKVFWESVLGLTKDVCKIHLSYTSYASGNPDYVPEGYNNLIEFDPESCDRRDLLTIQEYVLKNNIKIILGFDQPPKRSYYKVVRDAGVDRIISYYGAPMSSLNGAFKLALKRVSFWFARSGPDCYVFESKGMERTATHGRGISPEKTKICKIGVDTQKFRPDGKDAFYAHDTLGISREKKLLFYSGHFEDRKGISVIMAAANELVQERTDFVFVLFGNTKEQEAKFRPMLSESARDHVHFGGYRDDLNRIHRSCYLGVIASIGWDSFTVSSIEMQSSGLPLVLSDLLGLQEAIVHEQTGIHFPPGDGFQLASVVSRLLEDPSERDRMAEGARERVIKEFSRENQIACLTKILENHLI
jgi:glycosyltransferase involved in cell wall biosynthesis